MGSRPIFQTDYEMGVWSKLDAGGWKSDEQFTDWVKSIISKDGELNSDILVKAIDLVIERKLPERIELVRSLANKHRQGDCMPQLTAANFFLDIDDVESAKEMESSVKNGLIPQTYIVRARISIAEGDLAKARKDLIRVRCSDTVNLQFYDLIQQIDPNGGWMFRRNIEFLVVGKDPIPCGSTDAGSIPETLYNIYREWYRGSRDEATRMIVSSEEYKNKNPEFMLASARMSMDEKDWHSAQMMYGQLLSKKQNCVYIICEAANAYYRSKDYEKALARYRDAEALDPRAPAVMKGLINTYHECGMTDEAIQCMQEYLDTENAHYASYEKCARLLLEWGKYDDSAKIVSRITECYPDDPEICMLSSKIEVGRGDLDAALEIAGKAMRNDPKVLEYRVQYASVLVDMDRKDRAEREIEKVLKSDPENVDALLLKLRMCISEGDRKGVESVSTAIMKVDPGNKEASEALSKIDILKSNTIDKTTIKATVNSDGGQDSTCDLASSLIQEGRYSEAIDLCREYESKYKNCGKIMKCLRGNAEYCSGAYRNASVSFASAAAIDPSDPMVWHSKGMADEMSGDLDSAEEAYSKAIMLDLDEPRYWISRSSVSEKKGDLESAVKYLNRAIDLDIHSAYALAKKGKIFAMMGKYDEALYFLDMAETASSNNIGILRVKRDVYLMSSRSDKAIEVSESMISKKICEPKDIGDLAILYADTGDKSAGAAVIDTALKSDPTSIPILKEKKRFLSKISDIDGEISVTEKILQLDPEDHEMKSNLADIYIKAGRETDSNRIQFELQRDAERVDQPLEVKDKNGQSDGENAYQIALSLMKTGDLKGAERMAGRALSSCPSNPSFILLRAEIYEVSGDVRSAEAFLSDVIRKQGNIPEVCEADGDLKVKMGDDHGALVRYESVISGGRPSSQIYAKMGFIQERMGVFDQAINSFISAVIKNPKNADAYRHLVLCQLSVGKISAAEKSADTVYQTDRSAMTVAIRAKVYSVKKEVDNVRAAYNEYLKCSDKDQESQNMIVEAMTAVGLKKDADQLLNHVDKNDVKKDVIGVSDAIKRQSERVLRRAYITGTPLNDPDLIPSLGMDTDTADSITDYLSKISEYGDILPGTPEYERMERLSANAIIKGNCIGLEKDPIITIPCAFVAGGAKDADEAKMLVSYIYKAMSVAPDVNAADPKIDTSGMFKGIPVEDIVKEYNVGVYCARGIKKKL